MMMVVEVYSKRKTIFYIDISFILPHELAIALKVRF